MPVGVEHQYGAADAGLKVLLGGVPVEIPFEQRLCLLDETVVDGSDGDDVVLDAEVVRQLHGIVDRVYGRPGGWHEDAGDMVLAQGLRS